MTAEREKRTSENGTVGTAFATLLNALVDMQASPAYAVRKGVLAEAEQTILALEKKANENAEAACRAESQYVVSERSTVIEECARVCDLLAGLNVQGWGRKSTCAAQKCATEIRALKR